MKERLTNDDVASLEEVIGDPIQAQQVIDAAKSSMGAYRDVELLLSLPFHLRHLYSVTPPPLLHTCPLLLPQVFPQFHLLPSCLP
jgi:hypothetical protein